MSIIEIVILSIGLGVDASCVCTASGLIYKPKLSKALIIAIPFAVLQWGMPLLGYFGINLLPEALFKYNHIAAFILLAIVGTKMLVDGIKSGDCSGEGMDGDARELTFKILMIQGISTSIDALSVGVTLIHESIGFMMMAAVIIGVITYGMCIGALYIGKSIGTKFNCKAEIVGGIVLILLGIKLLVDGM